MSSKVFYDADTFSNFLGAFDPKHNVVVGHNSIGYDAPALSRIWSSNFYNITIIDTLVLSRLDNPSRECGHSLESLGQHERTDEPRSSQARIISYNYITK